MKKWIVVSLMALPMAATAQDMGGLDLGNLDAAKIQAMLEKAEIVQACMAKADQTQLQNLQVAAETKGTEIDALCQEGNRTEAQAQAVAYGQQLISEPLVKEMQDCVGIADLTLPLALWAQTGNDSTADSHVCNLRAQVVNGATGAQ
jgi:hypothetical protein